MPTLIFRLVGPMQSWGISSRFSIRDTGTEPSKSGVIGLVCAALGKPRDESTVENAEFRQLANLKMGVRVDREGVMKMDYHTAQNFVRADGKKAKENETILSWRYYLSDACFVVALAGDDAALLQRINARLKAPHWQLSLGRKAFLPSLPIHYKDELHDGDLQMALGDFEFCRWQGADDGLRTNATPDEKLRVVYEDSSGGEMRHDQPVSLALGARRFLPRYIHTTFITPPKGEPQNVPLEINPQPSQS
jgi:CRISPR system Cascade subunit CasD